MKKWSIFICVFLTLNAASFNNQAIASSMETIIFLRHAEKPWFDFGQLTCQGLNRALALPNVLIERYGKPDYIFAPNPYWNGFYYYVRALVTIEPTAILLNMPVQTKYQYFYDDDVCKELLSPKYHQALVIVSWEHFYIVKIASKLMSMLKGNPNIIPYWPDKEYDSLYILKIDWSKTPPIVKFIHDKEHLNNQNKNCPKPVVTQQIANKADFYKQIFVLIPSAETVSEGIDQLTCQGLNRALALSRLLDDLYPNIKCFVLPSAASHSLTTEVNGFNFLHALMTIEPTIVYRGGFFIPVGYKTSEAVKQIKAATGYKGTAVITWPREGITRLARELYVLFGGNPKDIPDRISDINTIYQISVAYNGNTPKPEFSMIYENLNNQLTICPSPMT